MSEATDPAIQLFGKTIKLPDISAAAITKSGWIPKSTTQGIPSSPIRSPAENYSNKAESEQGKNKDSLGANQAVIEEDGGTQPLGLEDIKDPTVTSVVNDLKFPSSDNVNAAEKLQKTEKDHKETNKSEEMALKKPDKILPCPRCNSMDTKFCYFNNYNVNQPRHYCKNCQRYWTAGGTMRTMPVGAGRRKSKNLMSHFCHVTATGAPQNARPEFPNGIHHPNPKLNSTILAFSSDTPLGESMTSLLNIAEKTTQSSTDADFHKPALRRPVSCEGGDDGDDHSIVSSVTAASSKDEVSKTGMQDPVIPSCQHFAMHMPFLPGAPWPYPLNSAQRNSPIPPPSFGTAAFPIPVYPTYWGCTVAGTWNVPWINLSASQSCAASTSSPNSPTLGKHSREDNMPKQSDSEEEELQKGSSTNKCLWIPKTLRINDPGEAAKSSIWTTLGIKNDDADSSNGSLFKPFPSKAGKKNNTSESSTVLQANPAALSRSHKFHESS